MKSGKFIKSISSGFLGAAASVVLALLIGSVVLLVSGINPITAYSALFYGAFGNMSYFGDTLSRATPIIFTGLAVGFGFKGGLFNIGAEGQLVVGAIAAAIAGYALHLPPVLHVVVCVLAGLCASCLWALVPAVLKAKKGVHEVISTIMMNYIAYNLGGYVVEALRQNEIPQTPTILESAQMAKVSSFFSVFSGSSLNTGFLLAIAMAVVMYVVINKTVYGYDTRALGCNPAAAEDSGVNVSRQVITVMAISGMLAGLAGTERVLGLHHTYLAGISTNFGFEGIAVALLAKNNPLAIIFSALLFGALSSGGLYMNLAADVPVDIVGIIQGLIILFAAISQVAPLLDFKKLRNKKEVAV